MAPWAPRPRGGGCLAGFGVGWVAGLWVLVGDAWGHCFGFVLFRSVRGRRDGVGAADDPPWRGVCAWLRVRRCFAGPWGCFG